MSCANAGHCYYFLEDVYPRMTGRRPLKTPGVIKALFPEAGIGFMRTRPSQPHSQRSLRLALYRLQERSTD